MNGLCAALMKPPMVWFVPPAGRLRRAPGWTRVAASATSHHRSEQLQRWRRHRHDALGLKALRASADETAPMPWDASKSGVIPYQKPPKEIQALVDADLDPVLALSPGEEIRYILELKRPPRSPIRNFALEELRLAGIRFYPAAYTPARMTFFCGIGVRELDAPDRTAWSFTGLASGQLDIGYVKWSPDGAQVAFCTFDRERGLDLWLADIATRSARCLLQSGISLARELGIERQQTTDITQPALPERLRLNGIVSDPFAWCGNTGYLLVNLAVYDEAQDQTADPLKAQRWQQAKRPTVPFGPTVQVYEAGRAAPARTIPDLLRDEFDMEIFELYTTTQLALLDTRTGRMHSIGGAGVFRYASPSPDGKYLLVERIERPYSTSVPASRFPRTVEIYDLVHRALTRTVAHIPAQEHVPLAFDATVSGPRAFGWRQDDVQRATLVWVEAQDQGDPEQQVSVRDVVYCLRAPFSDTEERPRPLIALAKRFGGITWGDNTTAVVSETWYKSRSIRTYLFEPAASLGGESAPSISEPTQLQCLFDIPDWEDAYRNPGNLVVKATPSGKLVLHLVGPRRRQVLLTGSGASDQGNRPFLDLLDLDTRARWRLWQSAPPYLEYFLKVLEPRSSERVPRRLLISRESPTEPSNCYIIECMDPVPLPSGVSMDAWTAHTDQALSSDNGQQESPVDQAQGNGDVAHDHHHAVRRRWRQLRQVTWFPHPAPSLASVQRQLVRYERSTDQVRLSASLYLPPGYDKTRDGPLPFFVWAYPREFLSADSAGQLRDSPYGFTHLARVPLYWLTQGFGILEGPSMPIIGPSGEDANDTFIEQLVASARAAVAFLVSNGYADPQRIAIGGHSYGAFMAANLLCHAPDLFRCGIARSGAYNRTLTPFGFQNEQRTLWQARDVYVRMSPCLYANQIQAPLLLIHGEDDDNPGTYPLQSERFFQALKGQGKIARLVLLPLESHSYQARESVLHVLAEMDAWLKRWCAPAASSYTSMSPASIPTEMNTHNTAAADAGLGLSRTPTVPTHHEGDTQGPGTL